MWFLYRHFAHNFFRINRRHSFFFIRIFLVSKFSLDRIPSFLYGQKYLPFLCKKFLCNFIRTKRKNSPAFGKEFLFDTFFHFSKVCLRRAQKDVVILHNFAVQQFTRRETITSKASGSAGRLTCFWRGLLRCRRSADTLAGQVLVRDDGAHQHQACQIGDGAGDHHAQTAHHQQDTQRPYHLLVQMAVERRRAA